MPDPNAVSSGANGGRVDLSGAPGADISFDDLFPSPEVPAQQPQAAPGNNPQQQPQAQPAQNEFFLRNADGSIVYRTAEDAIQGIAHKDSEVAKYREFLKNNGYDPNRLERVESPQASQPQAPPSPYKYYKTGKLFDALSDALSHKDMARYEQIQAEHAAEAAQDEMQKYFAPYQPLIAETARQRAIREVSREIPDFANFYGTDRYKSVKEKLPLLAEMEVLGESNPVAAQRLPELYKMSYLIDQGLNRSVPQNPPAQSNVPPNPPTARPPQATLTPSSLTPPPPGVDTRHWAQTGQMPPSTGIGLRQNSEVRRQLIKDFENKGIDNMDWSRMGT